MYLYGSISKKENSIIFRVSVYSQIYLKGSTVIRTLNCMAPYAETHLVILSSDNVFTLYDVSTNLRQPEQEDCLQPMEFSNF